MIITGSECGPGPACPPGTTLLASVDVEWTKNYRVPDGNVPFCYSVVWLNVPSSGPPVDLGGTGFSWISAYVESQAETQDLVTSANGTLAHIMEHAGLLTGHQLCSDLAVLTRAATRPPDALTELRAAWRQRRLPATQCPLIIDTRYDIEHLLSGASRRLVDVCGELRLDVTQPELRGTSMTALHRRWTQNGDAGAREKITVLNLRHSLSTALAALRAAGTGHWNPGLNVNQILAAGLGDTFGWTNTPVFRALLEDRR